MKKVLLKAENICKSFGGNTVLQSVSCEIFEGDFTVIMGASGAGKSTLLYALSGMDKINAGSINFKDTDIFSLSDKKMSQFRSRNFGFVFQQTHLVSNLTLFENVIAAGYSAKLKSPKEIRERAENLLKKMNVSGAENRLPSQTSGGESQRAAIARAIINEPSIIFADEPTGALNRTNTDDVLKILAELNHNGQSIVMVTHDLHAAAHGNRIIYLADGKIIDELDLGTYDVNSAKEREHKLSDWLSALDW